MYLILQSSYTDNGTLRELARLVNPQQVFDIGLNAIRCVGIHPSQHWYEVKAELAKAAQQHQVDLYWKNDARRITDFKLLAMDMDSTLITIECIDEIADMQGLKPQVAAITESAMRGEIPFSESLKQRVALLKGLSADVLQQVYDERVKFSLGAENLIAAAQGSGLKILLVSGGFTYFTDRIKSTLKLDFSRANVLEVSDGKLTGQVLGDIVDAEEKRRTVEQVCQELGIAPSQAVVIGDGANDLAMMKVAGLSVAFRAKPVVREQADVALNFVGLDGLLNLI